MDVFELYWKHFRRQLQGWWGELSAADVRWIDGKRERLVALLESRYGYTYQAAENVVREHIDAFEQRHRTKSGSLIQARRPYVLGVPKENLTGAQTTTEQGKGI